MEKKINYEAALSEIEEIVNKMETTSLTSTNSP